ncbi:4'-phosphopantetheinyl transferase superfamily protein [Nonomuraea sp. NN258]|uniref:4'-phosphopantetheinyl transferase family protein n=1 Tax=Nonomuraea antri TaxID=2730852 RepID=UPI001568F5DE|nr:4'-phosphopantetheinyl transferase superfamily protein [Nonomuraea antri]NRQ31649.1 4'-phosphopantetheinyl transferase superfamily protein [Nonomuraea antri]
MLADLLPGPFACAEAFAEGEGEGEGGTLAEEEPLTAGMGPRRRRDFADGRACARRALAALGLPPGPVLRTSTGAPRWPDGVVGSITHCAGYRAAVVAWQRDVPVLGVDAEPNLPLPPRVLNGIALPEERAWVERLDRAEPGVAWGRLLFCVKEAVYKAWSPWTGRWLGFTEAVVSLDRDGGVFTARLPRGGLLGRWGVGRGLLVTAATSLTT